MQGGHLNRRYKYGDILNLEDGLVQTLLVPVSLDNYAHLATETILSLQTLSLLGFLCHVSSIFGPSIPSSLDSVLEASP